MRLESCAFSPGKVILLGEHFVVHGAKALVAAIDQGSTTKSSYGSVDEIVSENLGLIWREGAPVPAPLLAFKNTLDRMKEELKISKKIRSVIHTDLPISAGLGSSSSSSVSFVASILNLVGKAVNFDHVYDMALEAERVIHGNPSGVDVFIGVNGGVHLFQKDGYKESIALSTPVKLIIVNTGISRSTSGLIAKFSNHKRLFPAYFNGLVKASSNLTVTGARYLGEDRLEEFGLLMTYQHAILAFLGVSCGALDDIVNFSLENGALGAKLTGAGGGGCAIVLPEQSSAHELLEKFNDKEAFMTCIPTGGLRVWME
ncbi:MAG: mevalonate kinase [Nitrososphaeria archaeon]